MEDPTVAVTVPEGEELMTVQEFAVRARLHYLSVYRMVREERLPGVVRVGRHIRIVPSLALAYAQRINGYKRV